MLKHRPVPDIIFNNKDFKGVMVFHTAFYLGI
jgi:hypothetical protein